MSAHRGRPRTTGSRARVAAGLLTLTASAACSGGVSAVTLPSAPPSAAGPSVAPSPAAREIRDVETVTLSFAGDVNAIGAASAALSGGLAAITPALSAADLTMVNLETAITDRGTPAPKQYAFRAPPTLLTALQQAGVDVVTLANNHGVDYGPVGLADSLAAARSRKLPLVGAGEDAATAYRPYLATVRGQRIAFLGATQVLDDNVATAWTATSTQAGLASAKDEPRLLAEVRAARAIADTVVVYLHWGQEKNPCPLPRQQTLAQALVTAGADVVVGSHAHVLLGSGYLGGAYVDYGLGNFVFASTSEATRATGVLTLRVRGRTVSGASWAPARITGGVPAPLTGAAATRAVADREQLRGCTGLSAAAG